MPSQSVNMRASIVYAGVLLLAFAASAILVAHPTNDIARSANADADSAELSALQAMMAQIEAQNVEIAQIEGKHKRAADTPADSVEFNPMLSNYKSLEEQSTGQNEAFEALGERSTNLRRDNISPQQLQAFIDMLNNGESAESLSKLQQEVEGSQELLSALTNFLQNENDTSQGSR